MTDQDLYNEENRKTLIDLNKSIALLNEKIDTQIENYVAPKDEITVKGEVIVNTEKEIEVTNLESIKSWLEELGSTVSKAIKSVKPITEITVKNIDGAKQSDIKVSNIQELAEILLPTFKALLEKETIVNVTKQDIVFPTLPTKAIPVRLSDGKSFYNAIFQAISQASGGVEDPLAGYQITDRDESTATHYYGYTRSKGQWYILKESSSGAYRYAKGAPLASGGGLYTDAWTNRANLTYDYYYEVF